MEQLLEEKLNNIIRVYDVHIKGILEEANDEKDRAFGGVIRADKGKLVEWIAAELVRVAWQVVLKQDISRLEINKKKMPIGIKSGYTNRVKNEKVREYIENNESSLIYKFGTDVQVYVDNKLVLPIECKAYTENAMIKRIIFDAELMKEAKGVDTYYLLQLESQLCGDYCELNEVCYGSATTHALLSRCSANIEIITLLKGERRVDRPIHKPEFYKELKIKELEKAVMLFVDNLRKYVR